MMFAPVGFGMLPSSKCLLVICTSQNTKLHYRPTDMNSGPSA